MTARKTITCYISIPTDGSADLIWGAGSSPARALADAHKAQRDAGFEAGGMRVIRARINAARIRDVQGMCTWTQVCGAVAL